MLFMWCGVVLVWRGVGVVLVLFAAAFACNCVRI